MKVTLIILLFCCFLVPSMAQNCDIAQTGIAVRNVSNSAPVTFIVPGQQANFKFKIVNFGTDLGCSIPANTVTAIFDFPTLAGGVKPYIYDGPQSFVSGYFSWSYDAVNQVLQGTNITAIPNGNGDLVFVKIKGNIPGTAKSNLNMTQAAGISDNTTNNFSWVQMSVINGPVPVKLSVFNVVADHCDANLNWSTQSEMNFSHFEVEYSPDAITYIKVGSVDAKNISTGADYKFTYSQLNGVGYYRLKLVDKAGSIEYSDVVRTRTNCKEQAKALVYPNPVNYDQKLVVNISGYGAKASGELFNAAGQRMAVYDLVDGANELSVMKITSGVYMLYVRSEEVETKSFKVIVTR